MGDSTIESSSDPYGEDPVEFRRHVLVLAANWRKIALGAVLTAGAAGALMWALWSFVPKYEASADVAIIHAAPKVSIDETPPHRYGGQPVQPQGTCRPKGGVRGARP